MMRFSRLLLFLGGVFYTSFVLSHHSFAIYDFDTEIPFEGTVESLKFRNPHIAMSLKTVNEQGEEEIVEFVEGAPANMLVRSGLRPDMIKAGSKIKAVGSPLKDDPSQYFLRKIILENGKEY